MSETQTETTQAQREEYKRTYLAAFKAWVEAEMEAGKNPYVLLAEVQQDLQQVFE